MTREEQIIDDSTHDLVIWRKMLADTIALVPTLILEVYRDALAETIDPMRCRIAWLEWRIENAKSIALGEALKAKMGIPVKV